MYNYLWLPTLGGDRAGARNLNADSASELETLKTPDNKLFIPDSRCQLTCCSWQLAPPRPSQQRDQDSGVGKKARPRILERLTTSSERNQIFRKKSFNWTISTQYTQQYYHLFQTFNMPWRRGTARKSRGLPIQISRLIIITYSAIY